MLGTVILVVIAAIGLTVGVFLFKAEQKRRAALVAWATRHGWTYKDRDDTILQRLEGTPFETGHSRKATDVMAGPLGDRHATVFGYQYSETHHNGSGTTTSTSKFHVFVVSMPCAVGHLAVKPEGLLAKLGNKVGFADVQLESDDFNRAYRLTASSQKLAYNLVPAATIELLLDHVGTNLHTDGDLLVAVEDGTLNVAGLDRTLALLGAFLDNVPSFVWEDHGADRHHNEKPPTP